nr:MAG TPA: hypothetical protein [Caudoviricetes sp.]DAS13607.1 MAG TPA: hypothetical protein [Caudoviricetes sp.]
MLAGGGSLRPVELGTHHTMNRKKFGAPPWGKSLVLSCLFRYNR